MTFKHAVQAALTQEGINLPEFARLLYVSIEQAEGWLRGDSKPTYGFLVGSVLAFSDWRHDWALKCLAILRPELWAVEGEHGNPN